MSKCPYTYPHRSKAAQIEYLYEHESRFTDPGWCPLVWNVKIRDTVGNDGTKGEYTVRRWLDQRWHEHTNEYGEDIWNSVIDDMTRLYTNDEYTSYPGLDQGDWKFFFFGRSNGWMGLEKWKGDHLFRSFCGNAEWHSYLLSLSTKSLKTLYRGVLCMDSDFTRDKIQNEYCYHLNWVRHQWEETLYIDPLIDAMRTALWNQEHLKQGELCETR